MAQYRPIQPAPAIPAAAPLASSSSSKSKGKRKEIPVSEMDDLLDDSSTVSGAAAASSSQQPARPAKKPRKKATRACHSCQTAHLTCDDSRPCARCVKRGLAETCQDGKRKKAKYLADFDDEVLGRRNDFKTPATPQSATPVSTTQQHQTVNNVPSNNPYALPPQQHQNAYSSNAQIPQMPYNNAPSGFGSEQANLEYAMLSSMLNGQPSPSDSGSVSAGLPDSAASFSASPFSQQPGSSNISAMSFFNSFSQMPSATSGFGQPPQSGGQTSAGPSAPAVSPFLPPQASALSNNSFKGNDRSSTLTPTFAAPQGNFAPNATNQPGGSQSATVASSNEPPILSASGAMKAEDVYRRVTKPYPYARSYHELIRHLKDRFDKMEILRIVRALAKFRPSLIALQMPLTEEDEVFVEKCFQRTLIEYEKLITFSGTPTVVWRRTGEICLVGTEFSYLCQWDRKELVGKKRYIFEILDNTSVVEYYEALATHAFENSTQTVMTTCVLLTPENKPVPCSFCFTIKRDLFNCPSLIVGQFLPLLNM